jgi:hypothetical protein
MRRHKVTTSEFMPPGMASEAFPIRADGRRKYRRILLHALFKSLYCKRRIDMTGSEQVCFLPGKFPFSSTQITLLKYSGWDHHYLAERGHYYFLPLLRDICFDKDDTSLKLKCCNKM